MSCKDFSSPNFFAVQRLGEKWDAEARQTAHRPGRVMTVQQMRCLFFRWLMEIEFVANGITKPVDETIDKFREIMREHERVAGFPMPENVLNAAERKRRVS